MCVREHQKSQSERNRRQERSCKTYASKHHASLKREKQAIKNNHVVTRQVKKPFNK